jgi:putative spermidine/putrescine transport system ATP-binding protein
MNAARVSVDEDDSYVRVSGVSKEYRGHGFAVRNLNLTLPRGEFLTLLGPSGSGKTTTLQMVAGFIPPTDGTVEIDGRAVTDLRGVPKAERIRRVGEALELVQLTGTAKRLPRQLSGGQQQRVALARAIVFKPALLLMDEPLGALDRHLRESMAREITGLVKELGATTIYVTHDQDEALTMSDRIAVFKSGYLEQIGTVREVYERPSSRFVAGFLGESTLLQGRVDRSPGMVTGPGWKAVIPCGLDLPDGSPAAVAIRPHIAVLASEAVTEVSPGFNRVCGVLRTSQFLGSETRHVVDLDNGECFIVMVRPSPDDPSPGERVTVAWPVGSTQVLGPDPGASQ